MLFRLFRKNKRIPQLISAVEEIEKNLDWVVLGGLSVRVSGEAVAAPFDANIVQVSHASDDASIMIRPLTRPGAHPVLHEEGALAVEYISSRSIWYRFHSYPLCDADPLTGEFRAGYPSVIEALQDLRAVRCKTDAADLIRLDIAREQAVVVDIGSNGLKFTCNRIFEKGTVLKDLKVDLPKIGPVNGTAVVRYMQPASEYPLWRYLCGAEFAELTPKDQKRLDRFVARLARRELASA